MFRIENLAFGVLAGGRSSRIGSDKSRLPIGARSFLEAVLDAGSLFPQRIVSLSRTADEAYAARLRDMGMEVVRDDADAAGPLEGIRQILCRARREACLIVATDMPLLTRDFLIYLAQRYDGGSLALTYRGRIEPLCSIYSRDCIPAIEDMLRQGLRRPALLFERTPSMYIALEESGFDARAICNINNMEEYNRIIEAEEKHE